MSSTDKSKTKKEVKVFDNKILESFTRTNAFLVIYSFLVLSLVMIVFFNIYYSMNILVQIGLYLSGVVFFTFMEYIFHRYAYHLGEYKNRDSWNYSFHGAHHDEPNDKDRLAMPLIVALILATVFFFIFYLALGVRAFDFTAGFMLGYAAYLYVHNIVHTKKPPKNAFGYLWKHHHIHHYIDENKAFGVSTPLWDYVFRTMPPKLVNKAKK